MFNIKRGLKGLIFFLLVFFSVGSDVFAQCTSYTGGTFIVSPANLTFKGYISNGSVVITSSATTVSLNGFVGSTPVVYCWWATKGADWITLTPSTLESEVSPIPSDVRSSFAVGIDASRLPAVAGTYTSSVTVESTLGDTTPPAPINVTVTISATNPGGTQPTVPTVPPQDCNATKTGELHVSPENMQFYINHEENANPEPIRVLVGAFVEPTDDGNTSRYSWQENIEFCWTMSKSHNWIIVSPDMQSTSNLLNSRSTNFFDVTIDYDQLPIYDTNSTSVGNGLTQYRFDGSVTVRAMLTGGANVITIPITVYVNYINVPRYAAEKSFTTTDWIDVTMNIPVARSVTGALYILAEHPTLAPGQVFAYRYLQTGSPTFTLFSQWGHPVSGAQNLWYVQDIHNTPIAVPFTENMGYTINPDGTLSYDPVYPSIPPGYNNWPETNSTGLPYQSPYVPPTLQDVIAVIPVKFGAGLRLIGMEGDWIVRALVGDPSNIANYSSWRELFYYVLHIHPITGNWIVTETQEDGTKFTYIDPCEKKSSSCKKAGEPVAYPLMLNENRGKISGYWKMPQENTLLSDATTYSKYANMDDELCTSLMVQGHRLNVASCTQPSGYEIRFTEPSLMGLVEYFYNVKKPVISSRDMGRIEGEWQYQFVGSNKWSLPLSFYGVKQEITIPLDPSCNCYPVNGKVNGVAKAMIVDTGASVNLISVTNDDYFIMGLTQEIDGVHYIDPKKCPGIGTVGGVGGGTVNAYICNVEIVLEDRLNLTVEAYLGEFSGASLLGMPYLEKVNTSISSADGTMIIAP